MVLILSGPPAAPVQWNNSIVADFSGKEQPFLRFSRKNIKKNPVQFERNLGVGDL
jgi:hypothetical protein